MTTHTRHITYQEAATRYGITTRRLHRLTSTGHLTRYKSHRDHRFTYLDTNELDQVLNNAFTTA